MEEGEEKLYLTRVKHIYYWSPSSFHNGSPKGGKADKALGTLGKVHCMPMCQVQISPAANPNETPAMQSGKAITLCPQLGKMFMYINTADMLHNHITSSHQLFVIHHMKER